MIVAGSVMLNNAGRNKALAALESFDRYFLYETYRVSDLWTEVRLLLFGRSASAPY